MEGRRRLSRGSGDVHTSQWQPMVGTPTLVPEPSTVIFTAPAASHWLCGLRLSRLSFLIFQHLDEAEAQLGEGVFQHALLFESEIAARLFLQHAEQVDAMARQIEIRLGLLFRRAEVHQAELHLRLCAQGQGEELEGSRRQLDAGFRSLVDFVSHTIRILHFRTGAGSGRAAFGVALTIGGGWGLIGIRSEDAVWG